MALGANYRRLWAAAACSNLADGVFQIALPILTLRLTRSPSAVAGVALAARLPWLLFALQAGALADRLDRRRTMVNVNLARVMLIGSLALVTASGHEQLWMIYGVAFALGIGETLFDTAAQSVMPMVVGRDDLPRANSRLYGVEMAMNQFVGPPLGGVLAAASVTLAFGTSAVAYAVAAGALAVMVGHFRPQRAGLVLPRLRTDIAEGLRFLWHHRLLRTLAAMVGGFGLFATAAFSVFPLFAIAPGPLGLSEAGFGVLLTATAVGAMAGSLLAPAIERRVGRARGLALAVVTGALSMAAPAVVSHVVPIYLFAVAEGVMVVVWNVITVSLRQRITPEHLLGRVNASYRLLAWGTMPIGAALGGLLGEVLSVRAVFAVAGAGTLLLLAGMRVVTDDAIDAADAAVAPAD